MQSASLIIVYLLGDLDVCLEVWMSLKILESYQEVVVRLTLWQCLQDKGLHLAVPSVAQLMEASLA